jgi:hypothetical protein
MQILIISTNVPKFVLILETVIDHIYAFIRYWRKIGSTMSQYTSYS